MSQTGASWDRVGAILEPEAGEVAVSHPYALEVSRTIYTFYASDVEGPMRIALGELIRRPLVGSPGHGPGTRGPGARRFERPHALRGEAARRVRWDVVRGPSDRRRGARLPHLLRAVPRALVALKRLPGIRCTRVAPKRYLWNWIQQGPDAKVGVVPVAPMMARAHDGSD